MFFTTQTRLISLTTHVRIILALCIGFCVIAINYYTTNRTRSDSVFSELVHNLADCVALLLLLYTTTQKPTHTEKILTISGGVLLILAGSLSLLKGYTTFFMISVGEFTEISHTKLFIVTSITIAIFVALQLLLVRKEHAQLHRHTSSKVLYTELWSDLWHACSVVFVACCATIFSTMPILVRFIDFIIMVTLSVWMMGRGYQALFQKQKQTCTVQSFKFPRESN